MELILERTELREDCTVGTLSVIKRVDDEYLAGELPRPPPSQKGAMQW